MAKLERVTALTIHTRTGSGTTSAKATRREGRVPGVLYGHGEPLSIAIDLKSLADLLATGGTSHIVDATVDGKHDSVLLREVQRDPISRRPISADFQRVSQTEAIHAALTIVIEGVALGVKNDGGVLDLVTHALDVKGPAGSLPDALIVNVEALNIGDHIIAGSVPLPPGFTLITPAETTVVAIEGARANIAAAVAEGETAAGTPATPAVAAT